jgi:hypothetical protein
MVTNRRLGRQRCAAAQIPGSAILEILGDTKCHAAHGD